LSLFDNQIFNPLAESVEIKGIKGLVSKLYARYSPTNYHVTEKIGKMRLYNVSIDLSIPEDKVQLIKLFRVYW